ncbi:nucleoside hydrolase [Streptomyces sp. NBC_01387]|uniref:nucleoside hydrolase n=1 Tax=unclassified Streptomyces TaxID=2593676 RepID=UPI002025B2FB|nr:MULTISPECIES: nucleoside hydrolase [unclassified Streptomyces]MCX4551327.1 nucleoside hydrolase [Streptomyces sp. NBC_01500]WSC22712.1 nucleoside hydrolase [Streptomyces sp. NBC_01766]WSV56637.1 nucleoside hydrolase [Streptomyces sp. NBC_01014]
MTAQPLYFDCDTGIDDSMALAYLLASPEIELVGVGTVSGNVDSAQAARNTLALIQLAGRDDIPVAVGAADPQAGTYNGAVPHIHGHNGIGDITVPDSTRPAVPRHAADLIIHLARVHQGKLRLLTTGPLTNIAEALRREPELPSLVKDITIMGGAAHQSGNVSPVTEANIGNDPEAAAEVLAAPWDITLVPLDVTLAHTLEEADRQLLLDSGRPLPTALGEMLDLYFEFHRDTYGRRCCALHDPLAAAIAVGGVVPTLAPVVDVVVDDTRGPGRGQTICDLRGQFRDYPPQPGAHCRVVLETGPDTAAHLVRRLLTL